MIPDEVRLSTVSNAERRLFARLRDDLNAQWTIFHSLGLARHSRKKWAEADFVAVGPRGVFCLEVKGGRVRREAGTWIFTDGNDVDHPKREGPFEQAKDASYALKDYLRKAVPSLYSAVFGWGVMTPDIRFDVSGPDITPAIVYDERDLAASIARYLRRVGEHWHDEHERVTGHEARFLTDDERRFISDALCGDFDLRPTLRARVLGVEEDLVQLTREQNAVLQTLGENPRLLVQGGAGTGKTLLALEEARRHAAAGKRVLLCCYSRALGESLARAVADFENKANVWAGPLPLLMEELVTEAGLRHRIDVDAQEGDIWDIFLPEAAYEAALALGKDGSFDVVIVDEGQDFGIKHLEVFDALLKNGWENGEFAVFYDPFQIPFRASASRVVEGYRRGAPVRCKLTINCRNTQEIAWATEALSDIVTSEETRTTGPDPQWIWTKDAADARLQIAACLRDWLGQGIAPADIVMLSPAAWEQSVARECKLPAPLQQWTGHERVPPKTFRWVNVSDFKGLEAKAVLLCDVNDWEDEQAEVTFYVGLSRPTSLLAVVLDEQLKSEWIERFALRGVREKKAQET